MNLLKMKGLFIAFVLAAVENFAQNHARPETLDLSDCNLIRIFNHIWEIHPLGEREIAAWIAVDAAGQFKQIEWSYTPQRRITIWNGPVPVNAVAQVHTHGEHLDPKPSDQDRSVARKLNIPVYVLTRKAIWKASPNGTMSREVKGFWFTENTKKCQPNALTSSN